MFDRQKKGDRAVLILPHSCREGNAGHRSAEFAELAKSAGANVLGAVKVRIEKPNPRYYIGLGKLDEVSSMARALEANLVLLDHLLSPVQERNLEQHLGLRVVDRAGLILDIFAQRASSHEGKLEVELAQLKHLATRVVRGWTHLDTQRGGAIGNRGPGETQLETDRRLLGERVKQITKRLQKVQTQRTVQRRARLRHTLPRVALVGYTNAGKSTLFNALTVGGVYAADQLFATLDPTVRKLHDLSCGPVVVADTVGFVRDLPHDLIAAFRGTLAEARDADLLLHVCDAVDEERVYLVNVVNQVLEEIGAGHLPQLRVINKIDKISHMSSVDIDPVACLGAADGNRPTSMETAQGVTCGMAPRIDRDAQGQPHAVWLSAASGQGLNLLRQALDERIGGDRVRGQLCLPLSAGRLYSHLMAAGAITQESVSAEGWQLHLDVPRRVLVAWIKGGTADFMMLESLLD